MSSVFLNIFYVLVLAAIISSLAIRYYVFRERQFRDVSSSLNLKLFKILLPQDATNGKNKEKKDSGDLFLTMEQLYAGVSALRRTRWKSIFYGQPSISFEIVIRFEQITNSDSENFFSQISITSFIRSGLRVGSPP